MSRQLKPMASFATTTSRTLAPGGSRRSLTRSEEHVGSARPKALVECSLKLFLADRLVSAHADLDAQVATGWGSVRWHLVKVLQEYPRHNGHADIIRERIDGSRGE